MKLFERLDHFEFQPASKCSIIGTTAAIIAASIAAAGAVGSSAIASHAASNAAGAQVNAANQASNLQYLLGQQGLDLQRQQYNTTQQQQVPFLQGGQAAFANLLNLMGIAPQGNLYQPGSNPAGTTGLGADTLKALPGGSSVQAGQGTWQDMDGQRIYVEHGKAYLPNGQPWTADSSISGDKSQWISPPGDPFSSYYDKDGHPLSFTSQTTDTGTTSTGSTTPTSLASLINPALGATGDLAKPFDETWKAPTAEEAKNDPGYQFGLDQGEKALQNSAAARGDLLSGGTAKGLLQFGNDYASTKYNDVFNRDLTSFNTKYNVYNQDQATKFNRLAALLGVGQTSASTLQNAGQNYANSGTTILNNVGANVGQNINNAGAARASGYVGSGNAISNGISGISSNLLNLFLASQLGQGGGTNYLQTDPTYGTGFGYHP